MSKVVVEEGSSLRKFLNVPLKRHIGTHLRIILPFFVLVGCWRPGRGRRYVENVENGFIMIVKTFLKLFFQRISSYGFAVLALKNNPFKIFFPLK